MQNIAQPDLNILDFSSLTRQPYDDSWITIGNFDGVHRGHQAIITGMVESAQLHAQPVLVVTFYPNPFVFFNQPVEAYYLSTPREKERQLLALGVDQVIILRFDAEFAALSAETFLLKLKQNLGLDTLVIGQDFALGKGREGSVPVLKAIGAVHGFTVEAIQQVDLGGKEISSTRIRQFLDQGAVDRAAELLGHPYAVAGEVIHGSQRGSRIGLPTVNINHWPLKKLPAVGVYASHVHFKDQVYHGITNVGLRPTFEHQSKANVETHILDFAEDIYGERIELAFIKKLRDEQKFSSVEAFLTQIERDKAQAQRIFQHG